MPTTTSSNGKGNILSYIAVFLLGILLAANIFFGVMYFLIKSEMAKMKSDDLTLAQAINSLSQQLSALTGGKISGPIIETRDNPPTENSNTNTVPANTNAQPSVEQPK